MIRTQSTLVLLLLTFGCAEVVVLNPGDPGDFVIQENKPVFLCPDDDGHEPNDVPGAAPLVSGATSGIRCDNNDDYFAFDVPFAGCAARGAIDSSVTGLELSILDARGIEIQRGPAVDFEAPEAGRYYARVFGAATEAAYNLDLSVTCPDAPPLSCPANDPAEPNNDAASAVAFTGPTRGIVCADDEDNFRVVAEAGCELSVGLFFSHADGDLDLRVLDPAGGSLASALSTDDDETAAATVITPGVHTIVVYGVGAAEAEYDLSVDLRCEGQETIVPPPAGENPADEMCPAGDGLTESADAPYPLDDASVDAVVCSGDSDHFDVAVGAGCVLVADLEFSDAHGDLDLELTGPGGEVEARSVSTTDNERVVETAESTSLQVLRVYGVGSAQAPYSLTTQTTCRADFNCTDDDPYEQDTAWSLDANDRASGIICGTDDRDNYAVSLGARCATRAELDFTHADGDVDILVKRGEDTVARGTSVNDDERVFFAAETFGAYELELRRFTSDNDYGLNLDTRCYEDLSCTDDDVYAPNATSGDARDISDTGYAVGIACNGGTETADWFAFRATSGCTFQASLDNAEVGTGTDIDLKVFDPAGAKVSESLTGAAIETVSFAAATSGLYKVKVEGFQGDEAPYELSVSCE